MSQEKPYSPREIDTFMEEIKQALARIEEQTTKHNGRMRSLELWKAGIVGALSLGTICIALIGYIWNMKISSIEASVNKVDSNLIKHIELK